jgi:phosphohistidine swiveling domain-containing protein
MISNMTDPFSSYWIYILLLGLCISLGWRVTRTCLISVVIAYIASFLLRAVVSGLDLNLARFPSISISILTPLTFWIVFGRGLSIPSVFSFLIFLIVITINRAWFGGHTAFDIIGGYSVAVLSIVVGKWIGLRKIRTPITSEELLPRWPDRIYVPPPNSSDWSRNEVAERYPDAVTPLFADLFLSCTGRAVQRGSRSLGIKKEAVIAGYRVYKGYVFSNFGIKKLRIPALMRLFLHVRKEFLDYALNQYPAARNLFWEQYANLDIRLKDQQSDLKQQYIILMDCLSLFEKWMIQQTLSLTYITFGIYYLRLIVIIHFPRKHKDILKALPLGIPTVSHKERLLLYRLGKLLGPDIIAWDALNGEAKALADQLVTSLGYQSSSYDFTERIWSERLDLILEMARSTAKSKESPEEQIAHLSKEREKAEAALIARIQKVHWISGADIGRDLIQITHTIYSLKEERQKQMAAAWALVKRSTLLIGGTLTKAGILQNAEDIYFLTARELSGLIHQQVRSLSFSYNLFTLKDISAVVKVRLNEFQMLRGIEIPEQDRDVVLELPWKKPEQTSKGLSGKHNLPGQVTAPAVVIRNQDEFKKMRPGFILVAPMTNPHWDILFGQARGVVIERGGPTSHAMLKASEYGLPAIIGLKGATEYIKDGDLVHIDGDNNLLTLEKPHV